MQDSPENLRKSVGKVRRAEKKSAYQAPAVTDYGDVTRLTQQKGTSADGTTAQGLNKHPYV